MQDSAMPPTTEAIVRGWGGGRGASATVLAPAAIESLRSAIAAAHGGAIARGLGRSYGDAAQLERGLVLEMTGWDRFELDSGRGVLTTQAGATLGQLLHELVPQGWTLPVVPGTQHVTVGGAIASDIHGKNHGTAGSFGAHVRALGLLLASGEEVELEPGEELFEATVGGMGLTGVILWAKVALRPVSSGLLTVDTDRAGDLDEAFALLSGPGGPHRVAWLDLLGPRLARGVVTRAEDRPGPEPGRATVSARATVPDRWPAGLLRPTTVRAFNELRYRSAPRTERGGIEPFGAHMFPLDALDAWPRLYGRAGFVQYQLVVPPGAQRVIEQVIERLRRSGVPCYLAVLKDFGPAGGPPMSFPIEGWTLALDLPRAAPGLEPLLDGFDELVAQAGGRVYLSKDSRMSPAALAAMYPRLGEWRAVRDSADPDGLWRSDLALRTGLVAGGAAVARLATAPGSGAPVTAEQATEAHAIGGPPRNVLLVGGSSEIAVAIARRLAADVPVRPYLLGRDRERLEQAAATLEQAGCVSAGIETVDADNVAEHRRAIDAAFDGLGGVDVVVLAVGVLAAQEGIDADPDRALEVMRVNFVGAGSLLIECLRRLRAQGEGTLVVLSSVAAERARASNAIYGAAKAGIDALAQGLADQAAPDGVRVLVVRPGFVRTRMTAGLDPAPFATTAEAVAEATVRALGGRAHTIWVPRSLRFVFAVLRHLPRGLYRRLPL
jgi:decaprenylphospho-beta-D-ribofuranose 2-oxidase